MFVGFGGGLTWASAVLKWDVTPPEVSFIDHEWKRMRYIMARSRSQVRRIRRRVEAAIGGSPTPKARLKDAENSKQ